VERLYAALAAGDADGILAVLAPSFAASFADGMPAGGGRANGPREAVGHWWAIGRAFAARAEVEEYVPCADGRLLVCGRYRGASRDGDGVVDAAFTHLWAWDGERLSSLVQVTDTARWRVSAQR
jgi:2-(1,2-epoxy-1,2-dihydrophenyl)acetyl-CoA isomerase